MKLLSFSLILSFTLLGIWGYVKPYLESKNDYVYLANVGDVFLLKKDTHIFFNTMPYTTIYISHIDDEAVTYYESPLGGSSTTIALSSWNLNDYSKDPANFNFKKEWKGPIKVANSRWEKLNLVMPMHPKPFEFPWNQRLNENAKRIDDYMKRLRRN